MPLRDVLTVRLAKEILGPREGARESIRGKDGKPPPDPSNEYVVGVLEPKDFKRSPLNHFERSDFVGNQEANREEDSRDIEEEDSDFANPPEAIIPELDPRALPKSVGISFVVKDGMGSRLGFCATWARYRKDDNNWKRFPYSFVRRDVLVQEDGVWRPDGDAGVLLQLRSIKVANGTHVSLFLVNSTPVSNPKKVAEEELVFQPQLRIVLEKDAELLPVRGHAIDGDSGDLALLYRERYALARGHLCGAMWKDIDPERSAAKNKPEEEGPPFTWTDGELLGEPERVVFSRADVRTEYLPCYAVEQAVLTGPPQDNLKRISSELLADAWQPDVLAGLLTPFIEAYERWIAARQAELPSVPEMYKKAAEDNLASCALTLHRIREGYGVLTNDLDARLAFCFMNKAMHRQSVWKDRKNPLNWYLFQVAFVLQCIPGITDPAHPDRGACDLLWFPTGAGKTEAYLGLSAFTMALRRRRARSSTVLSDEGGACVISRYTLRLLTIQQFRRALSMVTACEYLRTTGWLPEGYDEEGDHWGRTRFSIGLWVGASVTPNRLVNFEFFDKERGRKIIIPGAVGELFGRERLRRLRKVTVEGDESEPGQVLRCPACNGVLAVSTTTLTPGLNEIHWIISCKQKPAEPDPSKLGMGRAIEIKDKVKITPWGTGGIYTVSVRFNVAERSVLGPAAVDSWWENTLKPAIAPDCEEEFARASRPGYFFRRAGLAREPVDFEIRCPNPGCNLNAVTWSEDAPAKGGTVPRQVIPVFAVPGSKSEGLGMPIPAYTVDDQVFARCPSMIVSTVDKFARLAFEPRAASIFGYVSRYDPVWGYYRQEAPPETRDLKLSEGVQVSPFNPPHLDNPRRASPHRGPPRIDGRAVRGGD
jgi:hypothetical protein